MQTTIDKKFSSPGQYGLTAALLDQKRVHATVPPDPNDVSKAKDVLRFLSASTGVLAVAEQTGATPREVVNSAMELNDQKRASAIVNAGYAELHNLGIVAPTGHGLVVNYTDQNGNDVTMIEREYRDFIVAPSVAELANEAANETPNPSMDSPAIQKVCDYVRNYLSGLNDAVLNGEIKEAASVATYDDVKSLCIRGFNDADPSKELGSKFMGQLANMESSVQAEQARKAMERVMQVFHAKDFGQQNTNRNDSPAPGM